MPNVEWSIPFSLISPQGTLVFNDDDGSGAGHAFLLDPTKCLMGPSTIRTTTDDVPQADGGIVHRAFRSLMLVKFGVEFWQGAAGQTGSTLRQGASYACGSDLRAMWDKLMLHLTALVGPSPTELANGVCRVKWTPSGSGIRILDRVQILGWPQPTNDGVGVSCEFTLQTPFPYAIDFTQTTTALPATVTNVGNCPFYPVFKVYGPVSSFVITNTTTGLAIAYDSSLPGAVSIGGGDYIEIDTFRNTVYLNGNLANRKAGIVITSSDFFPLVPGGNVLTTIGAPSTPTIQMLWNNSWA